MIALRDKRGSLEAKSALVKIALVAQVGLLLSARAASAHFLLGDSVGVATLDMECAKIDSTRSRCEVRAGGER